jgi:RNA polymerase sigma factor (sigma-70 family)
MDLLAARSLYDDSLRRSMRVASARVPWDQALEIAHDVASELVRRSLAAPADGSDFQVTEALIHRAVVNRIRNSWRSQQRRNAAEQVHLSERTNLASAWTEPGNDLEVTELRRVLDDAIANMPRRMRDVFVLVREEGLSYAAVAARLGIGVGTVHTQLSRANAALRRALARYRGDHAQSVAATGRSDR